jgi:hypothetical protein
MTDDVRAWLRARGADRIPHPGGTLYAHLGRVHDRLSEPDLRLAGLTHAAYGTDGFDVVLLDHATERDELRRLVGPAAEAMVYRYGACDRGRTWPALADTGRVHDRFTGAFEKLTTDDLRPFVDLSIVNELDVVEHAPTVAAAYGDYFRRVFASWDGLASPVVMAAARQALAF